MDSSQRGFAISLDRGTYRIQLEKKGYDGRTITVSLNRLSVDLEEIILDFSINYHYTQIANSLFGFAAGPLEFGQRGGTIASIPTVLSTRLIDIIVLIVFPMVFLVASYMVFTRRQEK